MMESARISRGPMNDLHSAKATDVAAWVSWWFWCPALSNVAMVGGEAEAHPEVKRVIEEALAQHVPIGACCIAPAMLSAAADTGQQLKLTIGNDAGTASAIEAMGGTHGMTVLSTPLLRRRGPSCGDRSSLYVRCEHQSGSTRYRKNDRESGLLDLGIIESFTERLGLHE